MYKIVVDTKGSDNGAETIIKGVAEAIARRDDLSVLLVGEVEYMRGECEKLGVPMCDTLQAVAPASLTLNAFSQPA